MGDARKRGTREERIAQARERQRIERMEREEARQRAERERQERETARLFAKAQREAKEREAYELACKHAEILGEPLPPDPFAPPKRQHSAFGQRHNRLALASALGVAAMMGAMFAQPAAKLSKRPDEMTFEDFERSL